MRNLCYVEKTFTLDYEADWDDRAVERLQAALESLADRAIAHCRKGHTFTIQPFHAKIVSRLKDGSSASDKCDFGCAELAVAPSGNLYPCDRVIGEDGPRQSDVAIGHVDTGVVSTRISALRESKDKSKPECEGCAVLDRCIWWCGCVNRAFSGRVDPVNGLLCVFEKMGIEAADRMASTLFAEQNQAFLRRYYLGPSAAAAIR